MIRRILSSLYLKYERRALIFTGNMVWLCGLKNEGPGILCHGLYSRVNELWQVLTFLFISPAVPVFFATKCGHIHHLSWLDLVLIWRNLIMQIENASLWLPFYLLSVQNYVLSYLKGSSHAITTVCNSLPLSFGQLFVTLQILLLQSYIFKETFSNIPTRSGLLSIIQNTLVFPFVALI